MPFVCGLILANVGSERRTLAFDAVLWRWWWEEVKMKMKLQDLMLVFLAGGLPSHLILQSAVATSRPHAAPRHNIRRASLKKARPEGLMLWHEKDNRDGVGVAHQFDAGNR